MKAVYRIMRYQQCIVCRGTKG